MIKGNRSEGLSTEQEDPTTGRTTNAYSTDTPACFGKLKPAVHWRLCGDLKEIPESAGLHKLLAKDGTTGLGTLLTRDGSHSKSY